MVEHTVALQKEVRAFEELDSRAADFNAEELFHLVVSSMHQLCVHITRCERAGVPRDEILQHITPARRIQGRSPFIQRLQKWPRGYPGDFETIEYLCGRQPTPPIGTVEHACEYYCLTCAAAQQHRNKLQCQADLITHTVAARPGARILILASGSCVDVVRTLPALIDRRFELVINDSDPAALALAEHNLSPIHDRISFRSGDALRLFRHPEDLGHFDLILAGGLFDYLTDRQIRFILSHAYHDLLRSDSRIFFTNFARGNAYRLWMTYLADWHLIERSNEDIHSLVAASRIPAENISIEADQTTLTLLIQATNRNGSSHT